MPRVFVSHASEDRDLVEREIVAPLQSHGIDPWYAHDRIDTAAQWESTISERTLPL